ncbi:MAG: ABC transporter permease [Clostridia bacterium]|nr:ABC transporter permease [Clostridia bacterium]MBQ4603001.1 ABC transporter permease [Clostridia bacterium]MBR3780856.1 ABC transporter permease [Clostridia bacterium]MBR3818897.1 ABC transporter permease [Clostridia bacterium]
MIVAFIQRAIVQGIPLLFGSTGEIITEKSGNLNLGTAGVMYMGGISGVIGAFLYENSVETVNPVLAVLIPLLASVIGSSFMGLIYALLTVTLRANQNVTGLALTTFGVGFGNFFGGSLIKLLDTDVPSIALSATSKCFKAGFPFADKLGVVGDVFFSYSFLAYIAIAIALVTSFYFKKTKSGLHLRAVGENPATADAAGINVSAYKYGATIIGSIIAGLGGLYYVMDYADGVWSNDGFGDRGWLAIALVIFAVWRPNFGIIGSFLFGGLLIIHNYIPNLTLSAQELFKMAPYVVTIIVLVVISMRRKRENLPPASLGLSYFREER